MTRPRTFVASAIAVGAVESVVVGMAVGILAVAAGTVEAVVVGMAVGILAVAAGTVDSFEDVLVLLAD